jgi:hypothetical protein
LGAVTDTHIHTHARVLFVFNEKKQNSGLLALTLLDGIGNEVLAL